MAILDIVLLLCFVPAIVTGISKGLVRQVVDLLALIVGAWAAFHFYSSVAQWLGQYIHIDGMLLQIFGFILIILLVSLVFGLIGRLITRILKIVCMGWLNVVLGLIFSIFKTIFVLGLLIILFEGLNKNLDFLTPEKTESLNDAVVYNYLKDFANSIFPSLKAFITGDAA